MPFDLDALYRETESRMRKAVAHFAEDLKRYRTGRANPALFEKIKVNYYGQEVPLMQIAAIHAPDPRMVIIEVWDRNAVKAVEKAILESDLGFNPSVDGAKIKVPIPPLSEDRRRQLIKMLGKDKEQAKVAIRNIRRDAIDRIKTAKDEGQLPEDAFFKARDKLQEMTDKYVEEIEKLAQKKEKEIMEV